MELAAAAEAYVELCFELEKHVPGLVDSYSGDVQIPSRIKQRPAESLSSIVAQIDRLTDSLSAEKNALLRAQYLFKQLRALRTLAQIKAGEQIPYLEQVASIYDIRPQWQSERGFQDALNSLADLLPGTGHLSERLETFRNKFVIPAEQVFSVFTEALNFVRQKTKAVIDLPAQEKFEMTLVSDKPWNAYNWFKGNAYSLIEVNIDLPRRIDHVIHLMTHEGYPGHHTDHSIKEQQLLRQQGLQEHSIHPLFSPQAVIAEGIAEMAEEIILTPSEVHSYLRENFCARFSISEVDLDRLQRVNTACFALRSSVGNASILLHSEKRSEAEVLNYLRDFALLDPLFARKRLQFMRTYGGYVFCYHYGYDLLKKYFEGKNKLEEFRRCLSQQTYPEMYELGN